MRWFRGPARSSFHFMNAYSEGNRVHMYFGVSKVPPFPFMLKASGINLRPDQAGIGFVRWTFDLSKPGDTWEETVIGPSGDMPRTALKDQMTDFDIGYYQTFDPNNAPKNGPPLIAGPVGAGFNTILRMEVKTGRYTTLDSAPRSRSRSTSTSRPKNPATKATSPSSAICMTSSSPKSQSSKPATSKKAPSRASKSRFACACRCTATGFRLMNYERRDVVLDYAQ